MSRLRFFPLFFVIASIFISISAYAGVTVIVSEPPPMREVVYPPGGYSACYMVGARFHHGYWVPAHRVCEYGNGAAGNVWVTGYWQCVRYRQYDGVCRSWAWVPSHWAAQNEYEYRRPWHVVYTQPVYYQPAYQPVVYQEYPHHGWYHHHWYR